MRKKDSSDFYRDSWSLIVKLLSVDRTFCIHHGLYERGVYGHVKAVQNMNEYVGRLIGLDEVDQGGLVLDAGCGIGGATVFLAEKYPAVRFTGITFGSEQVKVAEDLAQVRGVAGTTKFVYGDFCATGFPLDQFDAVFLIESAVYASDKRGLFREMYRVLKPGGVFVVVDVFRTNRPLSPVLETVCRWFCHSWRVPPLRSVDDVTTILDGEGFYDIVMRDLTSHIVPSILRGSVIGIPYIVSMVGKKLFRGSRYVLVDDPRFLAWEAVLCLLLGVYKGIIYAAVTGRK